MRACIGEILHDRCGRFNSVSRALWNQGLKSASLEAHRFVDFTRFCVMRRAAILLATLLVTFVGSAASQPDRPGAPKAKAAPKAAPQAPPMIFYLAKGEVDACGEGCNE